MATLKELENKAEALHVELQTEIAQNEEKIAALKLTNSKLHKGMNRKISAIQKIICKAAEANDKQ